MTPKELAEAVREMAAGDCDVKCAEAEDRQDAARGASSYDCTPDFKYGYESGVAEGFRVAALRIRSLDLAPLVAQFEKGDADGHAS